MTANRPRLHLCNLRPPPAIIRGVVRLSCSRSPRAGTILRFSNRVGIMKKTLGACIAYATVFLCTMAHAADQKEAMKYWPAWRGPLATGEAPKANPPTEWSEKKNI